MATAASLSDASLFMDMDFFKEEDDAQRMDFPASSLELVQLLACDDDMFMDATTANGSIDDLSDAVTDDASSEMASPPPTYTEDDGLSQSTSSSPAVFGVSSNADSPIVPGGGAAAHNMTQPRPLVAKLQVPTPVSPAVSVASSTAASSSPPATMPVASAPPLLMSNHTASTVPTAAMLPFAFPVACFPPVNTATTLKRPLPGVMPNEPSAPLDPIELKKSKRALRQMKNRESANRSRLRRKAQLSDLSGEVEELTKKQHELQNTIAALQAENKSLHDQNAFLRSLVTMYSDPARAVVLPPVPSSAATASSLRDMSRPTTTPSDLESGHMHQTDSLLDEASYDEGDEDDEIIVLPSPKKQRRSLSRSAATVSAASLGLCASVFGLTILADSENGAAQSSHIRRPGRVLHSLPSTTNQGCSPSMTESMLERLYEAFSSSWAFLTTSELAYGVFLNVLSFVVIMGLYHCFQQYASSPRTSKRAFRWQNLQQPHAPHRRAAVNNAVKRRSVSWQDVRAEAQQHTADGDAAHVSPRVQVFT